MSAPDEEVSNLGEELIGDRLGSFSAADFTEAKDAFTATDDVTQGLGPIFNERGCGVCHTNGAIGGAGEQIERRFGRVANGRFQDQSAQGGSLRQLFTIGFFTKGDGTTCNVALEREPNNATVHNVGRLTTPLFGLGLVDAMPDSFFDGLAAAQPAAIRGTVNRVQIVLPNPDDPNQLATFASGGTRVGRFGWKAGVSNLTQFAADAYVNEMGITTQHCIAGNSVTAFSSESRPNGVDMAADECDDLNDEADGSDPDVPARTDEFAGSCAGGATVLQEDVELFARFMTALAPPARDLSDQISVTRGAPLFTQVGCNGCHVTTTFRTPANAPNGVPGNFNFNPFSDFLTHDMGALGDGIGNQGDAVAVTRRMRTAPLWGVRFRNHLLHDGRANDVQAAILAHGGQAQASRNAFNALSADNKHNIVQFVRSL